MCRKDRSLFELVILKAQILLFIFSSDRSARFSDRICQSNARRSFEGGPTSFERRFHVENVSKRNDHVDGKRSFTFVAMAKARRMSKLFKDGGEPVPMRKFKIR